ncbi:MAG: beta-lactamase family protein [Rhodobacteraceae bacterium]|nr:beta-lactamase family protein [Paracoccaceae bacterium]
MSVRRRIPNPDLTVGADHKQRWNRPAHRRHGFHNAHRLFRRALMVRSRDVLILEPAPMDLQASVPELKELMMHPAFSAFCCVRGDRLIMEAAAEDFDTTSPHSIQSVTKLHMHLIVGRLLAEGVLSLDAKVADYLPGIGLGYANATVQALLDMAVVNDFTEDYADPTSDCYTEEIALGWRLPPQGQPETCLLDFATGITGFSSFGEGGEAHYKSANTDVLTLIAASVSPVPLTVLIEEIADAAGYEGAFHISLSPEHLPAFSGGGCLSARDLARFGLLFTRGGLEAQGGQFANAEFLQESLARRAPALPAPKDWLRYSNHLMTDGRFVGHAGYGGQFLLTDMENEISCAYLSVLQNDAGYDDDYMTLVTQMLRDICKRLA